MTIAVDAPTFRFDAPSHTYWLGDTRLDHVTGVLKGLGFVYDSGGCAGDPNCNLISCPLCRGRMVHQACHYLALGKLNWKTLDDRLFPYVKGFDRFLSENAVKVLGSEVRAYHPVHLFAGTLDLHLKWGGWEYIPDIKSGAGAEWSRYQTGGYSELPLPNPTGKPRRRGAIILPGCADYKWVPHDDTQDGAVFLNMLTTYRVLLRHGIIKR